MMINDLILSFPVLKNGGGDFLDSVIYTVEANQAQNKLSINHALKGNSFISQLVKEGRAKFFVALFYKDNAERQQFVCESFNDDETNEITAEQKIDIDFQYAPEITPNIIVLEDTKITVDSHSGLSDFWKNEIFNIPAYTRIAHYLKLKFTSGDVSSLLNVSCDENFEKGCVKTTVIETQGEGEQPIKVKCAKDVFDELKKVVLERPTDVKTAMRKSIVTQILCHVYAYMNNLTEEDKESDDIHSGLLMHMETVKEKTGQDWKNELNASLAATKMHPYAIEALNKEDN